MKNKIRYILGIIIILGGISSLTNEKSNILYNVIIILLGVSLLPVIYTRYLYKIKINNLHILLPILIFTLLCIVIPNNVTNGNNNNSLDNSSIDNSQTTVDKRSEYKSLKKITDLELKDNFIDACNSINIDVSKIKRLEKIDDWNEGPRYTFTYEGQGFVLYAYENMMISSINLSNNLEQVYLNGYEPYDVNNYILGVGSVTDIQIAAESKIKSVLNYPSTANFKWFTTGGYGRYYDIYIVSGKFDAKNSYGVKSEYSFYIEEQFNSGKYTVVYMVIDGKKYIGDDSYIKTMRQERKKIDVN